VSQGSNFNVIVTEGRPDGTGIKMARSLDEVGVSTTLVLDSGVAHVMERVDMVLVGAEAVVENGGIVSKLGTFQIAVTAKAMSKPFYVAAESYKFARLFPLSQKDIPEERKPSDLGPLLPSRVSIECPSRDYTPPQFITLLITDLGLLTPAAVSDELIQLYL
jgi:translation initiation factor eIF-2B subunit alpha